MCSIRSKWNFPQRLQNDEDVISLSSSQKLIKSRKKFTPFRLILQQQLAGLLLETQNYTRLELIRTQPAFRCKRKTTPHGHSVKFGKRKKKTMSSGTKQSSRFSIKPNKNMIEELNTKSATTTTATIDKREDCHTFVSEVMATAIELWCLLGLGSPNRENLS